MSEKELRDYMKLWQHTFKEHGRRVCSGNEEYLAHIVPLDDNTVAIRILRYTSEKPANIWMPRVTATAQNWSIGSYQFACELLQWADNGGNWKGVGE